MFNPAIEKKNLNSEMIALIFEIYKSAFNSAIQSQTTNKLLKILLNLYAFAVVDINEISS